MIVSAPGVEFNGETLVTVCATLDNTDTKFALGKAMAEIDEWCTQNGYHRTENWPAPRNIGDQWLLTAVCARN